MAEIEIGVPKRFGFYTATGGDEAYYYTADDINIIIGGVMGNKTGVLGTDALKVSALEAGYGFKISAGSCFLRDLLGNMHWYTLSEEAIVYLEDYTSATHTYGVTLRAYVDLEEDEEGVDHGRRVYWDLLETSSAPADGIILATVKTGNATITDADITDKRNIILGGSESNLLYNSEVLEELTEEEALDILNS